jgi:RHS repeat-associated protein
MKTFAGIATVLLLGRIALAQVQSGVPPFSSWSDEVNVSSLNILVSVPIRTKAGAIPFAFQVSQNVNLQNSGGQWFSSPQFRSFAGFDGDIAGPRHRQTCPDGVTKTWVQTAWWFVDAVGTTHTFNSIGPLDTQGCIYGTSGSGFADDDTGYMLFANANGGSYLHDRSGNLINPSSQITDTNGNTITETYQNPTYTFADSLRQSVLVWTVGSSRGGGGMPDKYAYTDAAGVSRTIQISYSQFTQQTAFGCTGVVDIAPISLYLPTSVSFPDNTSMTLTYEQTQGHAPNVTGRVASVTLRTGAKISYTYSGGNFGINCSDGTVPTLTRKLTNTDSSVATWTYAHTPPSGSSVISTTTVVNAAQNETDYTFSNGFEVQRLVYNLNGPSKTLLETRVTCYNNNFASCSSATVNGPIFRTDVYTTPAGNSTSALVESVYDNYGNLTRTKLYDFGASSPATDRVLTYGTYSNGTCAPIGNNIYSRICTDVTNINGSLVSQTNYSYDTKGNGLSTSRLTGGSNYLTSSASYNANGTVHVATDTTGAQTTYTYGACNGLLPTNSSTTGGFANLSQSTTWDCNGAVPTSTTDANGKTTTNNYIQSGVADPFYRVRNIVDAAGNTTYNTYTPTTFESALTFNNSNSTVDVLTTSDGFGRQLLKQVRQAPGSSAFDTVAYTYDPNERLHTTSMPCSAAAGAGCSTATTTYQYDALNRPTLTTDSGGGTLTYTYTPTGTKYDVTVTSGPAPAGENAKSRQMEYDGLGRLTSVCEMTSGSGSGSCAQGSPKTGYWTKYAYDTTIVSGKVYQRTIVTQNAQSATTQTRSYLYDNVGRLVSESNPENGTTQYFYDSAPSTPGVACSGTYNGDLVKTYDANGNTVCRTYDGLHRVMVITYPAGPNASGTPAKFFEYDTPYYGSTGTNIAGRLVAAGTCQSNNSCAGNSVVIEEFGYSARGELTDLWEVTPHSGVAYHTTASYWANGVLNTLGGLSAVPTFTFTPDGEGRVSSVSASFGQNPLQSTAYNVAGEVGTVTLGTNDYDRFTYDTNTGRMTQYAANLNSGWANYGNLTWNANGTVKQLQTVDSYNSGDNQTCNYSYDDLARLASASCPSVWNQTFGYDPFGNVTKNGSISWMPGYNSSTNRYMLAGTSYDNNGNLLNDTFHAYTWDASNHPVSIDSTQLTYDDLGQVVEMNNTGTITDIVYTPSGRRFAYYVNGSFVGFSLDLPAGLRAGGQTSGAGVQSYSHPDWLGSARTISSTARTWVGSVAFAPFGETYAASGSPQALFTNQYSDEGNGLYDFPAREQHRAQGRWISPDPAGLAAVDPGNPQTWNRYAYVENRPLAAIDPEGTDDFWCDFSCGSGGGMFGVSLFGVHSADFPFLHPAWNLFTMPSSLLPGESSVNLPAPPLLQSIWQDVLGLPTDLSCPQWMSPMCGGIDPAMDASPANTLGIRAPGQTFNGCMQANAGNYSLLGVADFALNANGQIANNFWLGFTPASNTITNVYNAATGSLTSLLQAGPTVVGAGMGTVVTYGRRTSSIMSLNLSGTTGGPKGGFPALGSAPSNVARAAAKAATYFKLAVDAGFFLAEGVGCLIPR